MSIDWFLLVRFSYATSGDEMDSNYDSLFMAFVFRFFFFLLAFLAFLELN